MSRSLAMRSLFGLRDADLRLDHVELRGRAGLEARLRALEEIGRQRQCLAQILAMLERDEQRVVRRRRLQRDGLLLQPKVRLARSECPPVRCGC